MLFAVELFFSVPFLYSLLYTVRFPPVKTGAMAASDVEDV
jgi:hypothetical protein